MLGFRGFFLVLVVFYALVFPTWESPVVLRCCGLVVSRVVGICFSLFSLASLLVFAVCFVAPFFASTF